MVSISWAKVFTEYPDMWVAVNLSAVEPEVVASNKTKKGIIKDVVALGLTKRVVYYKTPRPAQILKRKRKKA